MQRNGARVWLYATAFFALSIAQAKAQATPVALKGQSPYLLGLGELFFGEFYPGSVILSRSSWFLQELAISLGNAIPTFIVHILRRFFHDRSGNTRFRPVVETNMMVRFQILDLRIIPVSFGITRVLRLFPVQSNTRVICEGCLTSRCFRMSSGLL